MPSPTYEDVITLVVSLPIRRVRGVLMNGLVQGHFALNNQIFFNVAKFIIVASLALVF